MGEVTPFQAPADGAALAAPVLLSSSHGVSEFDCGTEPLSLWLRKHALKNQTSNASRTYVVCQGDIVAGYYALASGSVDHDAATGRVKRNVPDPIPVLVLGRLAVDRRFAGRGIGSGMLADAMRRTVQVSEIVGIRALLVHAKTDEARQFYLTRGFAASPIQPLTLMVTVRDIIDSL